MSNEEEKLDANAAILPVTSPGKALAKVVTAVKDKKVADEEKEPTVILEQSLLTKVEKKVAINDIKLLREMFSIYSPSGDEHAMVAYISNYLTSNDIEHQIDSAGNIYFKNRVEGSDRIIMNAHMDTVANAVADVGVYKKDSDIIFKSKNNQVIGGDDKCGVFAVLKTIMDSDINVPLTGLLTVAEESGCNGVRHAMSNHMDYFADCIFWITVDRRGNSEIITENSDYQLCSDKVKDMLVELGADDGWKSAAGSISDVSDGVVALQINGINLAAGYYNAHMGSEYVSLSDLKRSVDFLKQTLIPKMHTHLSNHKDDITWEPTKAYTSWRSTAYGGIRYYGVDDYSSYDDNYTSKNAVTDWDRLGKVEDALSTVLEDIEAMEGYIMLEELLDSPTDLSSSGKSIRLMGAHKNYEQELAYICRHLDVSIDGDDALILIESIENYVFYAHTDNSHSKKNDESPQHNAEGDVVGDNGWY